MSEQVSIETKKLLLSWSSPARPFKKRDKDFFTTVVTLAVLSAVILLFLQEFLIVLVVFSIVFLVFVLSTIPPETVEHSIFTTGIQTGNHFYNWSELEFYRYEMRWGADILAVKTKRAFPGTLFILLDDSSSREKIDNLISGIIPKRDDIDDTWMDRASEWLSKKIPLEKNAAG
jgi:hypothetical protein